MHWHQRYFLWLFSTYSPSLQKQNLKTQKASLGLYKPAKKNQDVDEFVCSSEQIWINVALHHCLSNGSEWVPSEWESDKNITIIHSTQLTSGEDKSWNKSIIKMFLTQNESIIHNNVWCESGEKSAQIITALNKYVARFLCERLPSSLEEVLLWIMDSYLS